MSVYSHLGLGQLVRRAVVDAFEEVFHVQPVVVDVGDALGSLSLKPLQPETNGTIVATF